MNRPGCHANTTLQPVAGRASRLNMLVPAGDKDTPAEEAARVSYVEGDMPSLLRAAAAADMVRQYSTWLGRGCIAPGRPPFGATLGSWGGVRARWRGFAASAA